jgi:catechol 2,3-dioxygenase-like lactoylglutathione lyase family enzyme
VRRCATLVKPLPVSQIDHVELFVPDRHEAAEWYRRTLGLEIVPEYRDWASDPRGPLMISSDGGHTKLALFEGQPQRTRQTAGWHLVAFRVSADAFMECVARLAEHQLVDHQGQTITSASIADHDKAYSLYFVDPYGHRLEITTYDYEATRAALQQMGA